MNGWCSYPSLVVLVGGCNFLFAGLSGRVDHRHNYDGHHKEVAQEVHRVPRLEGHAEVQQLQSRLMTKDYDQQSVGQSAGGL